jgi:hypothetical protein
MLYLSGSKFNAHQEHYSTGAIGLIQTPASDYVLDGIRHWAMDNGGYTGQYPGDREYLALLAAKPPAVREACLFVALPDVLGDPIATRARSLPMIGPLREHWPVAYVLQDGVTIDDVPWDRIDWVFVGGTTEWKMGPDVRRICHFSRNQCVKIHVGRVNSRSRFLYSADVLQADSCDGTFLKYGPDINLPKLLRWTQEGAIPLWAGV